MQILDLMMTKNKSQMWCILYSMFKLCLNEFDVSVSYFHEIHVHVIHVLYHLNMKEYMSYFHEIRIHVLYHLNMKE